MTTISSIPDMNVWDLHQLARAVATSTGSDIEVTLTSIQAAYHLAESFKDQVNQSKRQPLRCAKVSLQTAIVAATDLSLTLPAILAVFLESPFLSDCIDQTSIEKQFGTKTAAILTALSDLSSCTIHDHTIRNYPSRPSSSDPHIVAILLHVCDIIRIHCSGVILENPMTERTHSSSQLLFNLKYFYIPLIHRMQLYDIQTKLSDFWLKYADTLSYYSITAKLGMTKWQREKQLKLVTEEVRTAVKKNGIDFVIKKRVKSVYSIWNKIHKLKVDFNQIHDLSAIRIIIKGMHDTTPEVEKIVCWKVLSIISGLYKPVCHIMRDWVSLPKDNDYESVHLAFETRHYGRLEVQIRTERMDHIAEYGNAAHWKYKCSNAFLPKNGSLFN